MSIDAMIRAATAGETVEVEPGWGQGRATFGGLIGALLVARMAGMLTDPIPLRTVTTFMLAPVTTGPVQVRADVLRQGRSVTVLGATMHQNGVLAASAQAGFGVDRESSVSLPATARVTRPQFTDPAVLQTIPHVDGVTPEFFQRLTVAPAAGRLPFSGRTRAGLRRLDEIPGAGRPLWRGAPAGPDRRMAAGHHPDVHEAHPGQHPVLDGGPAGDPRPLSR